MAVNVNIRHRFGNTGESILARFREHEREYKFDVVSDDTIDTLKRKILNRETNLRCPLCGEPLVTRVAKMYDLEDNLVLQPKAHCVKCVFQIKE